MAAAFTFGAAMTLRAGGHIRVTLVHRAGQSAGAALAGDGAWRQLGVALLRFPGQWRWSTSPGAASCRIRSRSPSATPLWIPQALVTFGICLLVLQFVARFFQALLGLPLEDLNMRAASVAE